MFEKSRFSLHVQFINKMSEKRDACFEFITMDKLQNLKQDVLRNHQNRNNLYKELRMSLKKFKMVNKNITIFCNSDKDETDLDLKLR